NMYDFDSPPSMSMLEEATASSQSPMMGVFNNLVLYDQHQKQNRLNTIVPDLATSWRWNEDGTELTLSLQQGVKWHDGQPFTAQDVVCTWDLMLETGKEKLRFNPRKSFYKNLDRVKIRRVQAERDDQGDAQPGLLEAGAALSRRDRLYDHQRPGDGGAGIHRGQGRYDFPVFPAHPAAQRRAQRGLAGQLRNNAQRRRQRASAGEPGYAAVRQSGNAASDGAGHRPQGIHRHPRPRSGRCRRRVAA